MHAKGVLLYVLDSAGIPQPAYALTSADPAVTLPGFSLYDPVSGVALHTSNGEDSFTAPTSIGVMVNAVLRGYDPGTQELRSLRAVGDDEFSVLADGTRDKLLVVARLTGNNGSGFWDFIRSFNSETNLIGFNDGLLGVMNFPMGENGTGLYDRLRVQSSTNAVESSQFGVTLATPPANWSITHTPAANTQATISRAAGTGNVRHICTGISAVLLAPATVVSGVVQLNLRDGLTGAGTILWSQTLQVGGATSVVADRALIQLSGLQIPGSLLTDMTLEFSAAGGAGTFESVTLTGYDVDDIA